MLELLKLNYLSHKIYSVRVNLSIPITDVYSERKDQKYMGISK